MAPNLLESSVPCVDLVVKRCCCDVGVCMHYVRFVKYAVYVCLLACLFCLFCLLNSFVYVYVCLFICVRLFHT